MTEELCRAKFEEWWEITQHSGKPPRFGWAHWREDDGYSSTVTQCEFEAFKGGWNTRAEMEKSDD